MMGKRMSSLGEQVETPLRNFFIMKTGVGSCKARALWMNERADTAEVRVLGALPSLCNFVRNNNILVMGNLHIPPIPLNIDSTMRQPRMTGECSSCPQQDLGLQV